MALLFKVFNSRVRMYSVNQPVNQNPVQPSEQQVDPADQNQGFGPTNHSPVSLVAEWLALLAWKIA